jgi:hypothetical protein
MLLFYAARARVKLLYTIIVIMVIISQHLRWKIIPHDGYVFIVRVLTYVNIFANTIVAF